MTRSGLGAEASRTPPRHRGTARGCTWQPVRMLRGTLRRRSSRAGSRGGRGGQSGAALRGWSASAGAGGMARPRDPRYLPLGIHALRAKLRLVQAGPVPAAAQTRGRTRGARHRTPRGTGASPGRASPPQAPEAAAAPAAPRPPQLRAGQPPGRGRKSGTSRRTERLLTRLRGGRRRSGSGRRGSREPGTSAEPAGAAAGTHAAPGGGSTHLLGWPGRYAAGCHRRPLAAPRLLRMLFKGAAVTSARWLRTSLCRRGGGAADAARAAPAPPLAPPLRPRPAALPPRPRPPARPLSHVGARVSRRQPACGRREGAGNGRADALESPELA